MATSPSSAENDLAAVTEQAIAYHRGGMLAEAEHHYSEILRACPDHFDALHLLGILRQQQGRSADAAHLIGAALKLNGRSVEALCSFGTVLNALNRHDDALAAYDQALAIEPGHIEALCKRGGVLVRLDRLEEALVAFNRVLAVKADHIETLICRGNTLMLLDRPDEALPTFDKVIELRPDHAMALGNRALSLVELGRYEDALQSFDRALQLAPDNVSWLDGCGNTLMFLGRDADALAYLDRATALAPDRLEIIGHRAEALRNLRRHDEAVAAYDRILATEPDNVAALYGRGKSLWKLGRLTDAMASHERGSALGDPRSLGELVVSHLAIADWAGADKLTGPLRAAVDAGHFVHSFAAIALELDPADQLRVVGNLSRDVAAAVSNPFVHANVSRADKLRIAYLSSDFWHHPVAVAVAELLERHDRARFEIVGVSYGPDDRSGLRARLVKACDRFHDAASENDRNVAKMLHDSKVHIAVDLNGLTEGFRPGVLACRPAPIQVNYLGYPGTTGAAYMDYIIADETVLPLDQQPYIAEKIVHLPDCYHVNDATRPISSYVAPRSDLGPPDQGMVFCCFNQTFKIAAPIFDIWMRLMTRVPGSVLWLSEMADLAQANLRHEAALRGVGPERLIFAPRMDSGADHLARHRAADLFLDTLPYNAHSTTCDALYAGLPVVTCTGATFPGRVATSMLKAIGLPELVTSNLEDYEALAFKLATDPALLSMIRRKLADNRSTCRLFDSDRFRRHIEAAYATMWDMHQRGAGPKSFRVAPVE
jgi:predicted O-linked N-acetylglucosamine transferase (SPINDLY family)